MRARQPRAALTRVAPAGFGGVTRAPGRRFGLGRGSKHRSASLKRFRFIFRLPIPVNPRPSPKRETENFLAICWNSLRVADHEQKLALPQITGRQLYTGYTDHQDHYGATG
jgi:hypothetical protein